MEVKCFISVSQASYKHRTRTRPALASPASGNVYKQQINGPLQNFSRLGCISQAGQLGAVAGLKAFWPLPSILFVLISIFPALPITRCQCSSQPGTLATVSASSDTRPRLPRPGRHVATRHVPVPGSVGAVCPARRGG